MDDFYHEGMFLPPSRIYICVFKVGVCMLTSPLLSRRRTLRRCEREAFGRRDADGRGRYRFRAAEGQEQTEGRQGDQQEGEDGEAAACYRRWQHRRLIYTRKGGTKRSGLGSEPPFAPLDGF